MPLRDWFSPGRAASMALNAPGGQLASPWAPDNSLDAVWPFQDQLWSELWGQGPGKPVTRLEAMAVPAVARSRNLICSAIGKLPLEVFRGDVKIPVQPTWAQGTDGQRGDLTPDEALRLAVWPQSPWQRLVDTVDDHFFFGVSLWMCTRMTADATSRPLPSRMLRVPIQNWSFDQYGQPVDNDGHVFMNAVVIPGVHEGILNFGSKTLRQAAALETAAADTAQHPIRLELNQTSDLTMTDTEIAALVSSTRRALTDNLGIIYTNSAIELKVHQVGSEAMMVAARNSSALDVARLASIPASLIDASLAVGATLSYSTLEGRNAEFLDYSLAGYLSAIEARLSMDDVVAAGQRVAFDLSGLVSPTIPATGTATED